MIRHTSTLIRRSSSRAGTHASVRHVKISGRTRCSVCPTHPIVHTSSVASDLSSRRRTFASRGRGRPTRIKGVPGRSTENVEEMARSLLIRPPNNAVDHDNKAKLRLKPHSFGIGGFVAENVQEPSTGSEMAQTPTRFDEARTVIRHYGGTRGDRTSLRLLEQESTDNIVAAKRENRLLIPPGIMMITSSSMEKVRLTPAELCYSILTFHILPMERSTQLLSKDVSNTVHLVGLTIQALSRESKAGKGFRLGAEGDAAAASFASNKQRRDPLRNAKLVDECLRRLVTAEVHISTDDDLEYDRTCYSMTKLYNMAMSSWAAAASSTNTGAGPAVSREAALRAERLLLEMANAGAEGQADLEGEEDEWLGLKSPKQQQESVALMQFVRPDSVSFNTVISAWTNSLRRERGASGNRRDEGGRYVKRQVKQEDDAAERAEAILQLMVDLRTHEEGDSANEISRVCPNALSFGLVMQAWSRCGQASAIDNIERLLEQMKEQNIATNPRIYSTVLSAYSKANLPDAVERADRLIAEMPREHMNTVVYNSLVGIHAVVKRRSWSDRYRSCERIDEIINDMPTSNSFGFFEDNDQIYQRAPDETTYGTALIAWTLLARDAANASDRVSLEVLRRCAERSRRYLDELICMRRHYGEASRVSLHYVNDVLGAYSAARMPLEAEELLQYVKKNHPVTPLPDSTSYAIVIDAHGNNADKLRWLREFEDSIPESRRRYDHQDGTQQYNAVIDGFCRSGEVEQAEAVLFELFDRYKVAAEEAKANGDQIIRCAKPNVHSFASVISHFRKQSSRDPENTESYIRRIESLVDKIEQLHESTLEKSSVPLGNRAKVRPNCLIYNMMISSYRSMDDKVEAWARAEAVLSRMKKYCKPDKYTVSTLLTLLTSAPDDDFNSDGLGSKATKFLRQIVGSSDVKITIDSVIFNDVLKAFVREGKLTKADEIFAMMPSKDLWSYSILISGYGRADNGVRAMELFDEMVASGIRPDSKVVE